VSLDWTNSIEEENLVSVASAAGVELEPIYAKIFAKALNGKDLSNLLGALQVGSGGGGHAAAAAHAPAGDKKEEKASKKEEKKEEEEEEGDDDM
jgi:large subunit ribosomal protein LP1